jgi:alanyl aminopeptidase
MRYRLIYGVLSALILVACGQEASEPPAVDAEIPAAQKVQSTAADDRDVPLGRLGNAVVPSAYRLELTILPDQDDFSGVTEIDAEIAAATRVIYLHGNGLVVDSAQLTTANGDSYTGSYQQVHETGVARIDFDQEIPAGKATLRISYTALFQENAQGLYKSTVADIPYTFTQFEPISARRVFPGFDEPVFKVPFDISVVARNRFATTKPLPTYLLAFAVGELDVVDWQPVPPSSVRSWPLPLRGIATRGEGIRMKFALENTAQILSYLEEYFGTEYPYAKLDKLDDIAGRQRIGRATPTARRRSCARDCASLVRQPRDAEVVG